MIKCRGFVAAMFTVSLTMLAAADDNPRKLTSGERIVVAESAAWGAVNTLRDGWSASNVRIFSGTIDKKVDGTVSARISAPLGANIWGHKTKVENTRTFTLAPGARNLSIVSALKNISGGTLKLPWQSRPEFAVSAAAQARMELLGRRGD